MTNLEKGVKNQFTTRKLESVEKNESMEKLYKEYVSFIKTTKEYFKFLNNLNIDDTQGISLKHAGADPLVFASFVNELAREERGVDLECLYRLIKFLIITLEHKDGIAREIKDISNKRQVTDALGLKFETNSEIIKRYDIERDNKLKEMWGGEKEKKDYSWENDFKYRVLRAYQDKIKNTC